MARPRKFDRTQLLDKALDVFWTRGYEATSVQTLGEAMQVHPGSFYDTFGDKHRLFLEVLDRYDELVGQPPLTKLAAPGPRLPALRQLFNDTVAALLTTGAGRGCLLTNTAIEIAPHDPAAARKVAGYFARLETAFAHTLRQAQDQDEMPLRSAAQTQAYAQLLCTCLLGLRVRARAQPDANAMHGTVRALFEVII